MWPSGTTPVDTAMQGTTLVATDDHALSHRQLGSLVNQLPIVFGSLSGTNLFQGYQAGWFPLALRGGTPQIALAHGTFPNATLGTPTIIGGIFNNLTFGTPAITGGTANNITLGTPTLNGGTANNITLGTPIVNGAVINTTNIIGSAVTNPAGTYVIGLSQTGTTVDPNTTPITGGTITLVTSGNPVIVNASVNLKKDSNSGYVICYLLLDGTSTIYGYSSPGQAGAFNTFPLVYFGTPAAGTHTFSLGMAVSSGTVGVNAFGLYGVELKR